MRFYEMISGLDLLCHFNSSRIWDILKKKLNLQRLLVPIRKAPPPPCPPPIRTAELNAIWRDSGTQRSSNFHKSVASAASIIYKGPSSCSISRNNSFRPKFAPPMV